MANKVLYICILFFQISSYAQKDTLNKVNEKGKKTGYWTCFLNQNFEIVDSSKGVYLGFDFYDNGNNLTGIAKAIQKKKNEKVIDSIARVLFDYNSKKYFLLDGKVLICNKDNILLSTCNFSKGHIIRLCSYHTFSSCKSVIKENLDFTRRYNNQKGSFYWEFNFCDGTVYKYWFRKGNKRWKSFRMWE